MAGHCEEQTSTARTEHASAAGQGGRWLLLIRLISVPGRSCPGQEDAAQQARESPHVALATAGVLGCLPAYLGTCLPTHT